MEQLLKLKNELSEGRKEVEGIKGDVRQMEQELKAQDMLLKNTPSKMVVSTESIPGHVTINAFCREEFEFEPFV